LKLILYNDQYVIHDVIENVEEYTINKINDRSDIIINKGQRLLHMTTLKCLSVDDSYEVSIGDIVDSNLVLEQRKKEKIEELDKNCEETILGGFIIPPDTTYTNLIDNYYGFDQYDQLNFNLQMTYLSEISPDEPIYWKTKNRGVLPHTIDEFKEVCRYAAQHKRGNIEKYWSLKEQVQNAATIEEVEAIVW